MIMILKMFCVFDSAVQTWRTPLFARSKGEMMRSFIDAVNDKQSIFAKHPADYTLFEIGSWDDDRCAFDVLKTPISLGIAIEFLKTDIDALRAEASH